MIKIKMKNITKNMLAALVATTMLSPISKPPLAEKCDFNVSLAQKSDYRDNAGITSLETPITEASAGITCGNFDGFIFGVHNNNTGNVNEVDVGIGYSFSKGNFSGRAGVSRWMYEEDGGKNDALELNVYYSGLPVDLGVGIIKILDDKGTQITGSVSKKFEIGKIDDIKFTLTPSAKFTYLDEYFGLSGHSNDVYGLSLGVDKGNFGVDFSVDYHRGHIEGLGNDTRLGVMLRHKF